ncbi:thiol-activated cytolysin family protein [Maribacter sp. MMG018]|uniref:thiol-activated cytolysin family protein n=1 Tax=Maribacter sp. MMG018 TaxID=2822688 RepID=UPI001B3681AD|nr:thiol-activated cytolysin family protein [Maribacter sp. MMG018]MBQ4914985.1 thiol-activated cytolysin family protein [Maribacter sp. MMG018]
MKATMKRIGMLPFVALTLMGFVFFSCSKDESAGGLDSANGTAEADINEVVANLSYNPDELLGVVDTGSSNTARTPGETVDSPPVEENNVTTNCSTTDYNLKTNYEEIAILKPNAGVIWPGALVKIDANLRNGLPTPVAPDRAPLSFRVDLPGIGENGNFTVDNPDFNSVDAGIDVALEWWNANAYQEGYVNEASSFSDSKTSYSSKQVSMDLGVNIEWASTDFSSQLSYESTSVNKVANMVYKQVFYTVSMGTPSNPSAVLGDDVSALEIESMFNSSAPPGYIKSVSYGRIIMFRLETSYQATGTELEAALDYAAGESNNISVDSEVKSKEILASSNITTIVIGGNAEVASEAVSARNFGDLSPIIKGENAVYSRDNPGAPISYTVRFLKDNTLAKMGYTEDYQVEECISEGKTHRTVDFINDTGRTFKFAISYNNALPGSDGSVTKADLDDNPSLWKTSNVSGSIKTIQPPNGAYDITIWVQDEDGADVYQYDIGNSTSDSNSCHRATTGFLGCCLKIEQVDCL